ncbi:Aldehyde dehydrogenase domain [Trinorchestia longiramus]|nr:Aldehyde dehydrogenase domain [Trinorchestia longiramus]
MTLSYTSIVLKSVPSKMSIRRAMTTMAGLHGKTLQQPWLLKNQAFINGKFVGAKSGKTFEVVNPASGKVIGSVPAMNTSDAEEAVAAAHTAFQSWRNTTAKERSSVLRRWFNLMEEHKEDLAVIMTVEAGKPLAEARGELGYGGSFLEFFAEEAKRIQGEVLQPMLPNREMLLLRQPVGVAGFITPWNFPNAMITRKAGAALAAGCSCVLKPAEDTPFSALALAALAHEAGVPPGVFNVITSLKTDAAAVGNLLCTSPHIAVISFTGSTGVGKILYEQCAQGVKKLGLELGGNAPFIVFNSARLDVAVNALMVAKFRNAGQACISANRVLVQSDIYDRFLAAVKTAMEALRVGDGLLEGITVGPLINRPQMNKVSTLVSESVSQGATVLLGGGPHTAGELFYQPTLLTDVTSEMPCCATEVFGPVVSVMKFDTEEEAVRIANDCKTGLAGYFMSQDVSQVWRVARQLEVGMVGINEGLISAAEAAFGGIKESGLGREGSSHGLDDYLETKYLCIGNTHL